MHLHLWKNANSAAFKPMFQHSRNACFIYNAENRFFTIYFHSLLDSDIGNYRVLQWVTGGYKGQQGLTRGY